MENFDKAALKYLAGLKKTIGECGISSMGAPHSPASVNITANSGEELSSMLKDIMNLAGVKHSHASSTEVLPGNEPTDQLTHPEMHQQPSMHELIKVVDMPQEEMIQDSMNDDQRVYDNSPDEDGKAAGNWPLDGDQDNNLAANKDVVVNRNKVTTAESLMADYRKFVAENYDFSRITIGQRRVVNDVINNWSDVPGNYESTMLKGIWHAFCDSGIMTDALSVDDAERASAAGIDVNGDLGLEEINDAVKQHDGGNDLECIQAIKQLTSAGNDIELLAAFMNRFLDESTSFNEGHDVFGDEEDDDGDYDDYDYDDDDIDDDSFNYRRFAQPGSALHPADDDNPRIYPCPNCKHPNRLTMLDKMKGYQCDSCANATERGTEIDYYDDGDYDNAIDSDDLREGKKWVQKAVKGIKKGALRKQEGKKKGEKFSKGELTGLAKSGTPKEKKRAQFALNISKKK